MEKPSPPSPVSPSLAVMLVNLRSAYNVGSIFRSSDAAGVDTLILTGYTPTPLEPKLSKTALGATDYVPWVHHCQSQAACRYFQSLDYHLVAAETTPQAHSLFEYQFPPRTCLIFGSETDGLSASLLRRVQAVVHIPQFGQKGSLNVATAAGICLFAWRQQYPGRK